MPVRGRTAWMPNARPQCGCRAALRRARAPARRRYCSRNTSVVARLPHTWRLEFKSLISTTSTDGPSRDALASGDRGYGRHMVGPEERGGQFEHRPAEEEIRSLRAHLVHLPASGALPRGWNSVSILLLSIVPQRIEYSPSIPVQDDSEAPGQGDDRLFASAAAGQVHAPNLLQPGPFTGSRKAQLRSLIEWLCASWRLDTS
jgi:hypothetical protein